VFWHVTCPDHVRARRLAGRPDLTQIPETTATWRFDRIEPDAVLHNHTNSPGRLAADVSMLLEGWCT
jgi:hypothetical protein